MIDETLRRAGTALTDLDAVAVADTPGLAGSLLVGLVAAKAVCVATGLPLIAVNHLQAHIYACRLAGGEEVFPCAVRSSAAGTATCIAAAPRWTSGSSARRLTMPPVRRSTRWPACSA